MLRITSTYPRRVVCFWGHATVRLNVLGWVAAATFTFSLLAPFLLRGGA